MSEQIIQQVDDNGKFLKYIPRMEGHIGEGKRHLGITLLVLNKRGKVLLQKRKHLVFDNLWCFTADTHPYKLESRDETIEQASKRALKEDFDIENIDVENLGFFNYFEQDDKYCENEYCAMVVGEYGGEIKMNLDHGYDFIWMNKKDFLKDFEENPEKYAPWVPGGIEILKEKGVL
jgi:isopentenyldiphosphate isomerase